MTHPSYDTASLFGSSAQAGPHRRHRALAWLLAATGLASIILLLVAMEAGSRSARAFQDVNLSGSLRYRSLWIYEATRSGLVAPAGAPAPNSDWQAQMQAMTRIQGRLHARYPEAAAADPAWNAFSGSLRRTGRVDWRTADTMRLAADVLTRRIAQEAASNDRDASALLRLGLAGLLCSLAASSLLVLRLRAAEGEMRRALAEAWRLAAIVQSSEEAILAANLEGVLMSWNAGAERLYGYAEAEVIGRHASVLVPAGEASPFDSVIPRLRRGETAAPLDVIRQRPDGTVWNVALTFSPIYDPQNQMIGVSCISRDITARRQAEDALRESEARLRSLSNAAFEGIAVSRNGVLLDANPAFLALYGYETREEIVGKAGKDFAAPASQALVARKIAAGEESVYEALGQRRDGSTFQIEVRGRNAVWDGLPARVTAVRDITERRALEDALHSGHAAMEESRARLAEAQRIAKVGSWEYDPACGAVVWSGEMYRLLGRDPALGVPEFEAAMAHYHPEDAPELKRLVRRAASEGLGYELDLRGRPDFLQDGHLRWYHTTGEVTPGTDGCPARLMGTLADITERKEAEQQIKDYMVVLEFQKSQLEETNKALEALATTDALTGLKNRRVFGEKLAEEHARAVRYHQPLSLLLLDVDHFKQYNDTFGHPAGDAVLRSIAQALENSARDTDVAARYGGEEFVVVMPQTDETGALVFAERLRKAIAGGDWASRPVTASIGVCTLSLDTPTPESMTDAADKALYHSKEAGRNQVTHGNPAAPFISRPKRTRTAAPATRL